MDEDFDGEDAESVEEEELDDESDEEIDEELEDDVDVEGSAESTSGDEEVADEEEEVPSARRKRPSDVDDDEDEEDVDPDDVEADLDAILKDRIAATPDEDEEDEEAAAPGAEIDGTEKVAAKSAEEFTCQGCFMIVHPRQFGRRDALVCPEGYSPCPSIKIVEKRLKSAAKK